MCTTEWCMALCIKSRRLFFFKSQFWSLKREDQHFTLDSTLKLSDLFLFTLLREIMKENYRVIDLLVKLITKIYILPLDHTHNGDDFDYRILPNTSKVGEGSFFRRKCILWG